MKTKETLTYKLKEIEGDMLTPIVLYHQLEGKKKFLFESSYKHEQSGRYSFLGANPVEEYRATGASAERVNHCTGKREQLSGHGVHQLKNILKNSMQEETPFPFFGGGVGYIGYDVIFLEEFIGEALEDDLNMPDIHFMFYDTFIVYDHLLQKVTLAAVDLFGGRTEQEMDQAIQELEESIYRSQQTQSSDSLETLLFTSDVDQGQFGQMVEKAKEHIVRGDIFQVVLSQRLKADFKGNPFSLYRRLRTSNPSPYMFYIDFDEYTVLGASPESLISVREKKVVTNPIAGTRPRGKNDSEDAILQQELLNDEKEIAEHRMLVDLSRNDLGRVCEIGSVHLTKYQKIEKYKHVMHIVSEVSGTLKKDIHPIDALLACLPAGTVSGAPKIRAMQIINDLETKKRGVYSGAAGYISSNGDLDFALAIRTMIIKDEKAYVQAGAGIVYDSVPVKEYEETMHKAKALLEVK
ncbi:anthranilate synthase component I [Bacillus thermotolerans]|uniref:Anthranilate synthase component 1 n=1 Tax=Bacillus thermotolerans TaxID=1221996 RepID=A0A0F5HQU4_BACTR|nr:anthranilate synthase component I [Bacillus thermotolerans]KKB35410.1 Anthranilate synthase, aminase component [Bacillus thermotolerans]KKB39036.1 Anthranilate synthase, aminase component [Bacillus thermotolerans]KKB40889.1 Anthranilate synthase, aminase component [Bacillus thermotolerans]